MKSNKINIKDAYRYIRPDGWAVTRMRARLEAEKNQTVTDLVGIVFRRYVLAMSVILMVLAVSLTRVSDDRQNGAMEEIATWIFGEPVETQITATSSEFAILADF